MANSIPHQVQHHSNMLADRVRLRAFRQSLKETVGAEDCVVDIGTGSGILASYAAEFTRGQVYALEYYKASAQFAKRCFLKAGAKNVQVVNASSYSRPIEASPQLAVTETIGAIGPEENIVEICYEFKKRYPSVKSFIPSQLKVFALPVYSQVIAAEKNLFLQPFIDNSSAYLDFSWALKDIEQEYCRQMLGSDISDAKACSDPVELANYRLGENLNSEFSAKLTNGLEKANGVHFFFEAKLSENIKLGSSFSEPMTHWKHRYVCKPQEALGLKVSYNKSRQKIELIWNS